MVEIKESHISSGLNELEKSFQEYKSKLEKADHEAKQIENLAWEKAENIIKDQQSKAEKIADETRQAAKAEAENIIKDQQTKAEKMADEMRQAAKNEADKIIVEARSKAAEIEKETYNNVKKSAKDLTKREIEKLMVEAKKIAEKEAADIRGRARKEAEEIAEDIKVSGQKKSVEESNAIIAVAEQEAIRIRGDSVIRMNETNRLIVEVSQKAENILSQFQTRLHSELAELMDKAKDNLDMRSISAKHEVGPNNDKQNGSDNLRGQRKLFVLPPYTGAQTKRFAELLKRIPGIKIDNILATEGNFSIFLNVAETIPLKRILSEISLVESFDIRDNIIKLKLKTGTIDVSEY